ncbi:MAG: zinc dependent phospholipase C family protein [Nitrospiraceae bacterium]|nr:zinc dependent phospholipase C family protein [Nitrospirota bacterium]MDA8215789.1 zinc dependent phospholipase C family protein [Nitrospiraceae bacterium]MDA8339983.1 zinc dependent phospholipase C family protein [Nitrospiraceae bacterium]
MVFLLFFIGFLLIPSLSFAWGPMTHMYLGSEIYSYAPLIPAGIMTLLRKYRQDFLYGNLMADMILGKKYLPDDKSSHNWDVGLKLMEQAKRGPEKAFVYGYLSHLAADTVAHEALTDDKWDVGHAWIEMKADSLIHKAYWLESVTINRAVQRRNDRFLESSLDRFIFSFNTNKRIYKGMVFLSVFNKQRKRGVDKEYISNLHDESIASVLDLLQNGKDASVLSKSPL